MFCHGEKVNNFKSGEKWRGGGEVEGGGEVGRLKTFRTRGGGASWPVYTPCNELWKNFGSSPFLTSILLEMKT